MSTAWTFEVSLNQSQGSQAGLCLDLVGTDSGSAVRLLEALGSFEAFEQGVAKLKADLNKELDRCLQEASDLAAQADPGGQHEEPPVDPEAIWAIMEDLNEEDFGVYFNGLDEQKRREVAEFVLTQVNMFKGKGPVFAARYDNETALLH